MAGTNIQLLTRFSCKLHVEREGTPLLGPACAKCRFMVNLHLNDGKITVSITPKTDSFQLPASPLFPRRFELRLIKKMFGKFASQGKLTLYLENYSSEFPNSTMYRVPPAFTSILISEAPPEAIKEVVDYLSGKPVKRQAESEPQSSPAKRQKTMSGKGLESLGFDLLSLIYAMVGGPLKDFRLLNRSFRKSLCYHVTKLRILDAGMASGPMVSSLIKRTTALTELSLEGCREFNFSIVKNAKTYPLRRLLSLNLKDCKKLNATATHVLLRLSPSLTSLNLLGCDSIDSRLLLDLSPRLELKQLKEISLSSFPPSALSVFFLKYTDLEKVRIDSVELNMSVFQALERLSGLQELTISYTEATQIQEMSHWTRRPLRLVSLLPHEKFIRRSEELIEIWKALELLELEEIACDVKLADLSPEVLRTVKKLTATNLPKELLPALRDLVLYTDGYDLLEHLATPRSIPSFLSELETLTVVLNSDWQKGQIADLLGKQFPGCQVFLRVISSR